MALARILVVEDDEKLNHIACVYLIGAGYQAVGCPNAEEGLKRMEEEKFDLIVSDIMMPGMDGFRFAEEVRESDGQIPILFMTARDDMQSKQRGFHIGIDDYLVKPFDPDELILRVGALLRRARIAGSHRLETGNLVMDEEEHTAYVNGRELPLTVREFDILFRLLSYPKKTFTRSQLMEAFWDYDSSATSRTVDVYMAKLREKTAGCDGFDIVTVHGLGYKAVLR